MNHGPSQINARMLGDRESTIMANANLRLATLSVRNRILVFLVGNRAMEIRYEGISFIDEYNGMLYETGISI